MKYIFFLLLITQCFAGQSKNHHDKNRDLIGEQNIAIYFSPNGGCTNAIVSAMNATTSTADLAIYSVNHPAIRDAIINAYNRGVHIRLVCDKTEAALRSSATAIFSKTGIPMQTKHGSSGGIMHLKMAILDKKTVILGSENWTTRAETKNDEDTIIISNEPLATQCQTKFNSLWK